MNKIFNLTCSGMNLPLAIDSIPRFSWNYVLKDGYQIGYSLCVKKLKNNELEAYV